MKKGVGWSFYSQSLYRHHQPQGRKLGNIIPQAKKSSTEYAGSPSPTATLEQLATAVKEVPSFPFPHRHTATLEFQPSSQCKYKHDRSLGFMAIFC